MIKKMMGQKIRLRRIIKLIKITWMIGGKRIRMKRIIRMIRKVMVIRKMVEQRIWM